MNEESTWADVATIIDSVKAHVLFGAPAETVNGTLEEQHCLLCVAALDQAMRFATLAGYHCDKGE